jgi:hypothetical protein
MYSQIPSSETILVTQLESTFIWVKRKKKLAKERKKTLLYATFELECYISTSCTILSEHLNHLKPGLFVTELHKIQVQMNHQYPRSTTFLTHGHELGLYISCRNIRVIHKLNPFLLKHSSMILGALHTMAMESRGPCTNSPREDKVEVH